jgi:hypothetical protein
MEESSTLNILKVSDIVRCVAVVVVRAVVAEAIGAVRSVVEWFTAAVRVAAARSVAG